MWQKMRIPDDTYDHYACDRCVKIWKGPKGCNLIDLGWRYCPNCGSCMLESPTADQMRVSLEDVLDSIRDMAKHPDGRLRARNLLERLEREYLHRRII